MVVCCYSYLIDIINWVHETLILFFLYTLEGLIAFVEKHHCCI